MFHNGVDLSVQKYEKKTEMVKSFINTLSIPCRKRKPHPPLPPSPIGEGERFEVGC
jgi:hypothetical protein